MPEMFEKQADIHQYSTRSADVGGIFYGMPNMSEVTSIFVDNQKFVVDNQKFVLTIRNLC